MRIVLLVTAIASFGVILPVSAQETDLDALWETYEEQAAEFARRDAECDEADPETTYGNRVCAEAADAGVAFAATSEALIEADASLSEEEQAQLLDGALTVTQNAGANRVRAGLCHEGRALLMELADRPELGERPALVQATETWIGRAETCIDAQRAAEAAADPLVGVAEPERGGAPVGPVIMLGVGGAALAGGLAWDLSLAEARDDHDRLDPRCAAASCTEAELELLRDQHDRLSRAQVPIVVLYAAGAASAVGGAIWWIVDAKRGPSDRDVSVRITPRVSRTNLGLRATVRW